MNSLDQQTTSLPATFTAVSSDHWSQTGEGVFSWSVFRFYRARLLTVSGVFDPTAPFLLDLHYLRTLKGGQIVSTSMDEITRLHSISEDLRTQWMVALTKIIPDVSLGDRLIGWFIPNEGVRFFSATQALGSVQDAEFVEAFSAIWLDERTRSPLLRQALLGHS